MPGLRGAVSAIGTSQSLYRGLLTKRALGLGYTYHLSVNEDLEAIPSLQAGVHQTILDTRLLFMNQMTGWFPLQTNYRYYSVSTGLLVRYKDLYAGLSVFGVNLHTQRSN